MRKVQLGILMGALIWIGCGGDTHAPDVQITNPINGSLVSGTVDVNINATDNEGVERIELYINDVLAVTLTSSPYSYSWNTESLADSSSHDIYAKAYDVAENEGVSTTITVTVYNNPSGLSIYLWIFDSIDEFYDSDVGDSVNCGFGIEQALNANGYVCTKGTTLPSDLDPYDIMFVTLGWFRC